MKIAMAQINPTVGDIARNTGLIKSNIHQAGESGAQLVVFGELALVGYPPKDLLLKKQFIKDNLIALQDIAGVCTDCAALVGFVARHQGDTGKALYNAAALLIDGQVKSVYYKQLLPTYDVFDESRYFHREISQQVFEFQDTRIGLTICEDIWQATELTSRPLYDIKPLALLSRAGVDMVINMSASPFVMGKHEFRRELFGGLCRNYQLPLIYVNQVGGNDDLIFDGCSCAFNRQGELIAQARDFTEDLLIIDTDSRESNRCEVLKTGIASIHAGLVLGLRDYATKCGFKTVTLGLSGGIDSAVTAALAVEALGADKVVGVSMPSRYSSDHSKTDAQQLARNLGMQYLTIPIEKAHRAMEEMLSEQFKDRTPDVTEENIQARVRGNILMALSNKFGHLVLTTGNKSELSVGYCTMYGDMAGGLAVISDVPKMMVYELAEYINREKEIIPSSIIHKPPSAELKPDQKDEDSLPPYAQLDEILKRYVEQEQSTADIIAAGFDEKTVRRIIQLVDRNEYKRKQAPPGLKVTSRAFGSGRRMPIAQNYQPRKS
ncbi:MAG: NAD+ synthase [Sedimentisphaerales bacterium]|nr:NAD+ synthase [Sedimentisphaerales bacterium]